MVIVQDLENHPDGIFFFFYLSIYLPTYLGCLSQSHYITHAGLKLTILRSQPVLGLQAPGGILYYAHWNEEKGGTHLSEGIMMDA
jgi:hypothetical protein